MNQHSDKAVKIIIKNISSSDDGELADVQSGETAVRKWLKKFKCAAFFIKSGQCGDW